MVGLCIIAGVILLIVIVCSSLKAILELLLWILGIAVVCCLIVFFVRLLMHLIKH